jgi:dihydrofolate reductase
VVDISMSVDGYVTGPGVDAEHGLGTGGAALHDWAFSSDEGELEVTRIALERSGAVVMGRRTFDIVDGPEGWNDEVGYGAVGPQADAPPNVVVTSSVPEKVRQPAKFTFVTGGIAAAVARARELAGSKDVVIMGGAAVCRGALAAGLVDELRLHVAPILLGDGTALFDAGVPPVALQQIEAIRTPNATHLAYRVQR